MSDFEELDLPEIGSDEGEDLEFSDLDLDDLERNATNGPEKSIEDITFAQSAEELKRKLSLNSATPTIFEQAKDTISPTASDSEHISSDPGKEKLPEQPAKGKTSYSTTPETPRSTRSFKNEAFSQPKPLMESTSCQTEWSVPSYISFDVSYERLPN
jgi:hypothetical protein